VKAVIFSRHEVVYYAVGLRDDTGLAYILAGTEPPVLKHMGQKNVFYVERVGQAPLHRIDLQNMQRERAERRVIELEKE